MSTNLPCKIRNEMLFVKCKEFFQKALVPLRPMCGREIGKSQDPVKVEVIITAY
jgi:hypothetical protein